MRWNMRTEPRPFVLGLSRRSRAARRITPAAFAAPHFTNLSWDKPARVFRWNVRRLFAPVFLASLSTLASWRWPHKAVRADVNRQVAAMVCRQRKYGGGGG